VASRVEFSEASNFLRAFKALMGLLLGGDIESS
jgi:hypothetical protein